MRRRSNQQFLWHFRRIAILAAVLAISTPWIQAQIATTTATISGIVADPTGAVVPNADVQLVSPETAISRRFVVDGRGRYTLPSYPRRHTR